jgi:hypothetical protein
VDKNYLITGEEDRRKKRMIDPNKIDWNRAPHVPADVLLRKADGMSLGGTIINGPLGQQTFIRDGAAVQYRGGNQMMMSMEPGHGTYGEIGRHFGHEA